MILVETSKREEVLRSRRPTSYSFLKKIMFSRVKPYTVPRLIQEWAR